MAGLLSKQVKETIFSIEMTGTEFYLLLDMMAYCLDHCDDYPNNITQHHKALYEDFKNMR